MQTQYYVPNPQGQMMPTYVVSGYPNIPPGQYGRFAVPIYATEPSISVTPDGRYYMTQSNSQVAASNTNAAVVVPATPVVVPATQVVTVVAPSKTAPPTAAPTAVVALPTPTPAPAPAPAVVVAAPAICKQYPPAVKRFTIFDDVELDTNKEPMYSWSKATNGTVLVTFPRSTSDGLDPSKLAPDVDAEEETTRPSTPVTAIQVLVPAPTPAANPNPDSKVGGWRMSHPAYPPMHYQAQAQAQAQHFQQFVGYPPIHHHHPHTMRQGGSGHAYQHIPRPIPSKLPRKFSWS
jgi:hypothetical protein